MLTFGPFWNPYLVEKLEPAGRIELPTYGLRNHLRPVPPVWQHGFSVGYDASHSGSDPQFGHEYAPHHAPRPESSPSSPNAGGFVPISSLLPSIKISKRRLRQLELIQHVREQRDQNKQALAYNARPFVLCGLPLRRPARGQLLHSRHSGKFSLQIAAHPQYGLPYGQDRLIPIWVATLALQQKCRTIHFDTAAEMLDFFQLPKDGPHYRRFMQGFQRIFAATIFFRTDDQPAGASVVDWSRFHFFDLLCLWFSGSDTVEPDQSQQHDNVITLSDEFYREIDRHRIPVEREAVAALANAPGALDFYIWLVWRTWTVKGPQVRIPLFGSDGLAEQLGTQAYSGDRYFRRKIIHWLRLVRALWSECPASLSTDGQYLIVPSSRRSSAINCHKQNVTP